MRDDDHQPRHFARSKGRGGGANGRGGGANRRSRDRRNDQVPDPTPPSPGDPPAPSHDGWWPEANGSPPHGEGTPGGGLPHDGRRHDGRGGWGRQGDGRGDFEPPAVDGRRPGSDGRPWGGSGDDAGRAQVSGNQRSWTIGPAAANGQVEVGDGLGLPGGGWWAAEGEGGGAEPTTAEPPGPPNGGNGGPRTARRGGAPEPEAASGGGDGFEDDRRDVAGDDGGSRPGGDRRAALPGWVVPVVLGAAAVLAIAGALMLDEHPRAEPVGGAMAPTTPVLSARRVPEVIAAPVADRRLTTDLQGWIAQSPPSSCLVVEAGDRTLFAHNPAAPLAGASTQKVVTSAALLLSLGPDARLETVVRAASEPSGGVVAGDLFVVGGGDPLLTSPPYAASMIHDPTLGVDPVALADAIVNAGITRIEGSVVGDGSRYDGERFHPTWPDRFRAREAGPIGALTVNDGRAGSNGQSLPPTDPVAADPAANAAAVVTDLLRLRGVTVVGPPLTGQAPDDAPQVATFTSPTVREIVAEMLTDSDDDTAEMALKEVGVQESGDGSWAGGAAAATSLLSEAGVALDGVQIVEGSGLSTANRLTCQLLVDLLGLPDTGPALVDGLAVAGQTGTLQDRWNGGPVEGRLVGKTGTLNSVTALSGRVTPVQGGGLMFAYVANVPEGQSLPPSVIAEQDTLGEILVNYPRGVDINTLLPALPAPTERG